MNGWLDTAQIGLALARNALGLLELILLIGSLASLAVGLLIGARLAWLVVEPSVAGWVLAGRARWIIHQARPRRRRHPMERIT